MSHSLSEAVDEVITITMKQEETYHLVRQLARSRTSQ
jgi:hypothetical protein